MTQSPSPSSDAASRDPDTDLGLESKKTNKIKSSLHTLPPVIAILADTGAAVFYVLGVTSLGDKPKALIGLGVVGVLVSLAYLIATEKRIYWLGTTALGLGLGLICLGIVSESSTGSAGFQSSIQSSLPSSMSTPGERGGHITSPTENALVGKCVRIEGVGKPAAGYRFRIGVFADPERIWVIRQTVSATDPGYDWYAWPVYVGDDDDFGEQFTIRVYEVPDSRLAQYDDNSFKGAPHSEQALDNDGVRMVHSVQVKRKNVGDSSCSSRTRGGNLPTPMNSPAK
ncbi:hypothetical protein [Amycolatopsis sp. NPDC051716]|uniref:hypothetical protein n=1 Tax=Amycolatopsis sp. NPDC051716 TaxID=3155804 RepID=UPI0034138BB6